MSADAYLRLLKKTILRFPLDHVDASALDGLKQWDSVLLAAINDWAHLCQAGSALEPGFHPEARMVGRDWPAEAETMIGMARLDQLHECITDVVRRGTVGDLAEIGVWRGGAALFMCEALKAYRDSQQRKIWVA